MALDIDENGEDVLVGHMSKLNPQWGNFHDNEEVLAIFNGPHTYVSSSWYEKENVPTWNYIAVHVYGKIKIIVGAELLNSLRKLVDKYEKKDKVVKWQLPVEQVHEEYYITFPDDLLEAANLKAGDDVEWVDRDDGSFLLQKVTKTEQN